MLSSSSGSVALITVHALQTTGVSERRRKAFARQAGHALFSPLEAGEVIAQAGLDVLEVVQPLQQ
eukprot:9364-Eustigmatos_ZCMA.PRE.1